MFELEGTPGRTASVNGKEFLFFSGYSYLGMNRVPNFLQLVKDGMDRYGILYPSSRISNTQLKLYEEFESLLSSITGQEKTVSFSSGYLAGRAVINALINDQTPCYSLPNTHPALEVSSSISTSSLEELVTAINGSSLATVVILTDGVNPLKALVNSFSFLKDISAAKSIVCVIDHSHGIGLIEPGIQHYLPSLPNVSYVISYSLSKAYNINGGAVSCSADVAMKLKQTAYYTGSTAIAPSLAYAFINAGEWYAAQQLQLRNNVDAFIHLVRDISSITYSNQLPIFILREEWNAKMFEEKGIIISSFAYPNPAGQKINRIVLNALHTAEDLERVSTALHALN
jgi:8-amino-7-oxononanoate synthase